MSWWRSILQKPDPDISKLQHALDRALERRDWSLAGRVLSAMQRRRPEDPLICERRGDVLCRLNRIDEAIAISDRHKKSHLAMVVNAGLQEFQAHQAGADIPGTTMDAARRALQRSTALKTAELKRGLSGLATIGSTAPFVGLLGTVIGIIGAFQGMKAAEGTGIAAVAGGIAGIRHGINGIPERWKEALAGRDMLDPLVSWLLVSA